MHGGLDVLASGEEKEGDVDGGDDSRGGETMAERPPRIDRVDLRMVMGSVARYMIMVRKVQV